VKDDWLISCTSPEFDQKIQIHDFKQRILLKERACEISIKYCIGAYNDTIFVGNGGNSICAFDFQLKFKYELLGHTNPVRTMAFYKNFLISASQDTIIFWDLNTKKYAHTILGLQIIFRLVVQDSHLFSAGSNGIIYIWDLITRTCIKSFHAHNDWIRTVRVKGNKLVSSSDDYTIKIWSY
jgi:WD40 repeat protein